MPVPRQRAGREEVPAPEIRRRARRATRAMPSQTLAAHLRLRRETAERRRRPRRTRRGDGRRRWTYHLLLPEPSSACLRELKRAAAGPRARLLPHGKNSPPSKRPRIGVSRLARVRLCPFSRAGVSLADSSILESHEPSERNRLDAVGKSTYSENMTYDESAVGGPNTPGARHLRVLGAESRARPGRRCRRCRRRARASTTTPRVGAARDAGAAPSRRTPSVSIGGLGGAYTSTPTRL